MRFRVLCLAFLAACSNGSTVVDASLDASVEDSNTNDLVSTTPDLTFVDPWRCENAATAPSLVEPLSDRNARAGRITRSEELIGGEGAAGRPGHFLLYNDRVRFVVQGATGPRGDARAIGYSLYGGNLIDADRVRPAGMPGHDLLRETFPTVGLRTSSVDEISVVCDGSSGRPAVVRVIGADQPTRLIAALDALAPRRGLRIITHYILKPGTEVLEVRTRVDSVTGLAFSGLQAGDFLAFGAGVPFFSPITGFGDPSRANGAIPYLIGASVPGENDRRVSYGIGAPSGGLTFPFADEAGTIGLATDLSAPAGGSAEFLRYYSVGSGDVASAARPLLQAMQVAFGTVSGTTDANAHVYAYAQPYRAGASVRMAARADAMGAFSLPLPAGTYELVAVREGALRGTPVAVTVTNGATANASPRIGATGTLVFDLQTMGDGTEPARAPMRVALQGINVEAPDSELGNLEGERENQNLHRVLLAQTGTERFSVKPGRYRATVSRGPEYETAVRELEVPANGEFTLQVTLTRVVRSEGYISGDFHQHTIGSVDAPRSLCGRVLENAANGLEYASTTDHDNVTDFAPCTQQLGLSRWFNSMRGNEISVVGTGHFNAYPLTPPATDPFAQVGAQYWAEQTAQQLFDRVRAEASDPVLHVSHPRSGNLKGYFTGIALDPVAGTSRRPLARGFEAIEVNESLGTPDLFLASSDAEITRRAQAQPTGIPVLRDWFSLLNRGEHTCALGNSDTHQRNDNTGWPRNFLRVGTDDPSRVTEAMIRTAMRNQQVVVSNGIMLRVRVDGMERMGWREVVMARAGMPVALDIEMQAPPWVNTQSWTLYENGRPMTLTRDASGNYDAVVATTNTGLTQPLTGTTTQLLRTTVRVRPARDAYYVVVARGGALAPAGHGDAFGYTNPTYVDVDGNGWRGPQQP